MRIGIFTSWVDAPSYTGVSYYICGLADYLPQTSRHEYTLVHFQEYDNKIYERAKEMVLSFPVFRLNQLLIAVLSVSMYTVTAALATIISSDLSPIPGNL